MRSILRGIGVAGILMSGIFSVSLHAQVSVTTYHNDNSRTGQNIQETTLTPFNVNSTSFGKLFSVGVDGLVYAQPLYLANVNIAGHTHNVLYVATEHDSVYAIDADSGLIYWQTSLIPAGATTVNSLADLNCGDVKTEIGITGTPVIDPSTGTLYVVAKSKLNGAFLQYLHALDVGTGAEKFGGPTNIQGSVAGTASDSNGRVLTFNVKMQNQRPALLLENGHLIIGWSSHCDRSPWHGWVMSYSASTLAQEAIYSTSPNGNGNGIWMSADGFAADPGGNIYFSTGNGIWNGTADLGDSVVKLGPPSNGTFPVVDYFTPYNQGDLADSDGDLSAGGLVLLPTLPSGQQLLTIIGKQGRLYLLDRNNLGKYCVTLVPACGSSDPQIPMEISKAFSGIWGAPAYWNGNLYWAGGNDQSGEAEPIKAYSFNANGSGLISSTPTSVTAKPFKFQGPIPTISASGATNGILWGLDDFPYRNSCVDAVNCQALYAYDATNLANLLYASYQAPNNRDVPPSGALKFAVPIVANGKVYFGGQGAVNAYGLLNAQAATATPTLTAGGTFTSAQNVTMTDATAGAVIYYTLDGTIPSINSPKYTTALQVSVTTTVKAIAVASAHNASAVASATYTINASSTPGTAVPVSLAAAADVSAIFTNGTPVTNGGLDGYGSAYSANLLGNSVVWSGTTFNLGNPGTVDAASDTSIALPTGNYAAVKLLATGLQGNQVNQTFVVTYTDGTTSSFQQNLSDWYTPQNYAGESVAVTMPYRVFPSGATSNGPFYLYGYTFTLNSAKSVKSITLPESRKVVVIAVTLVPVTTTTTSQPVDLSTVANVNGVYYAGTTPTAGGLDTHDAAYAENLLGTSVTWAGTAFTLRGTGVANAVSNATIGLPSGNFGTLELLATGVNGAQPNQVFVVNYTDGTTTSITQSLSDWGVPANYPGEAKAVTMAYRVLPSGATDSHLQFYVYGYSFAINSAKIVKSITLPANRNVVVLAAALLPPVATTTNPTNVALSAANVNGVYYVGTVPTAGGLDTHGAAYAENLLGTSVAWSGTTFNLKGTGVANAVSNATVALPSGAFSTLKVLAAGVNGAQVNQTFVVTYTDGSTTSIEQSLSDWGVSSKFPGESTALAMAYRVLPTGASDSHLVFYLYGYSFAINKAKTVRSIALPNNRNVVVLALSLAP